MYFIFQWWIRWILSLKRKFDIYLVYCPHSRLTVTLHLKAGQINASFNYFSSLIHLQVFTVFVLACSSTYLQCMFIVCSIICIRVCMQQWVKQQGASLRIFSELVSFFDKQLEALPPVKLTKPLSSDGRAGRKLSCPRRLYFCNTNYFSLLSCIPSSVHILELINKKVCLFVFSLMWLLFVTPGSWVKFKKQSTVHLIISEQHACWPPGN